MRSVHAEANAIQKALEVVRSSPADYLDLDLALFQLYTTSSPCISCAQMAVMSGLKTVFFRYPYRDPSGLRLLSSDGVQLYQVLPSGSVLDWVTKELVNVE